MVGQKVMFIIDDAGAASRRLAPLFQGLTQFSDTQRALLGSRYVSVLAASERAAAVAETWDTVLFFLSFVGALVVTAVTAIAAVGYSAPSATVVLVVSSLSTIALGVRERLKFKDTAIVSRRTASELQREGVLFLARAGPRYGGDVPDGVAFVRFVQATEDLKTKADQIRLRIRETEDLQHAQHAQDQRQGQQQQYRYHSHTALPQTSSAASAGQEVEPEVDAEEANPNGEP